jgi:hypothetical protein
VPFSPGCALSPGYPFEASVQSPSRPNGGGIATVLLDGVGNNRLPNYQNLDFHVDRPVQLGSTKLVPVLDIFNITNGNTVQALQRTQNAATANQISAVVAPRRRPSGSEGHVVVRAGLAAALLFGARAAGIVRAVPPRPTRACRCWSNSSRRMAARRVRRPTHCSRS